MHRGNLRLAGIGPERPNDWQQGGPERLERLERLLRLPDVEHLDLPIALECDVVEPTGGRPCTSRFQPEARDLGDPVTDRAYASAPALG